MAAAKLILFDCDSTLSAIEGIDELARGRGPEVQRQIEHMTTQAMEGKIPVEAVFSRRLELIRPTRAEVEQIGADYIASVEPTARSTIRELKERGWEPVIVSGGFRQAIAPLADFLGITRVEAVDLYFDGAGAYRGYDVDYPATRSGGKPQIIARVKRDLGAGRTVMVGDGVSDLETQPVVDLFVGFGRYADRKPVRAGAGAFIHSLHELLELLKA
ncbi:MAG: hypothetical protein RLZZ129_375 [Verrucomicrobiota bacterium]|nr:HAD-IB family phosphatase [Opitutaceae bacterium]HRJ48536.1 HAD-IB family phosphatase [Opitutaceae bacterium]